MFIKIILKCLFFYQKYRSKINVVKNDVIFTKSTNKVAQLKQQK